MSCIIKKGISKQQNCQKYQDLMISNSSNRNLNWVVPIENSPFELLRFKPKRVFSFLELIMLVFQKDPPLLPEPGKLTISLSLSYRHHWPFLQLRIEFKFMLRLLMIFHGYPESSVLIT